MHFRLTSNLAKKLKEPLPLQPLELHSEPLSDWSAELFSVEGVQYIILCHTVSMYSSLLDASKISDDAGFIKAALAAIGEQLTEEGLKALHLERIAPDAETFFFGKALNRSVSASVAAQAKYAESLMNESGLSLSEVARELNNNQLTSSGEKTPAESPRELFLKVCRADDDPATDLELPSNVVKFERPKRKASGRSVAEERWQKLAKTFDVSRELIRNGKLPVDFYPEHVMELRGNSVSVEVRPVLQFLLHVWDHSNYPFDLSNVIGWSDENLKAFGKWATGQTLRGNCRYFN